MVEPNPILIVLSLLSFQMEELPWVRGQEPRIFSLVVFSQQHFFVFLRVFKDVSSKFEQLFFVKKIKLGLLCLLRVCQIGFEHFGGSKTVLANGLADMPHHTLLDLRVLNFEVRLVKLLSQVHLLERQAFDLLGQPVRFFSDESDESRFNQKLFEPDEHSSFF